MNGTENKIVCVGGEIIEAKVTNPKIVLVSSPSEDIGFRNNIFFYKIQRYVSNGRKYDIKLSDNKD
jgi:hypothetical protein